VGDYSFKYGFLPHVGGFGAATVVQGAYEFNYESLLCGERITADMSMEVSKPDMPEMVNGMQPFGEPFICLDSANIVIEAVKPCEDSQNAFIVRLYECEGTCTMANIFFGFEPVSLELCDMLERPVKACGSSLTFRSFEIKTVKVCYC
jgi:alpha-mannosidase